MEVSTEEIPMVTSNQPGGSPALTRDASHTPGRDILQPRSTESAVDGTHANGMHVENETRTSSPTTTAVPERAHPPASQPPSAQPPSQPSTQPLTQLSTQPSSLPTRPLSEGTHKFRVTTITPHGHLGLQPHQHHQGFPSYTAPPPSRPSPSQVGQPHQEPQDMNKVKKPRRFPSPNVDYDAQVSGFSRDASLVADAIQQACPEAVRSVVRDQWEKCVLGTEFHHAFLMNATMHNASGEIMRRAIRDFGQNMVKGAKMEIASHLRPEDLDEIAPIILEKCSERFLDKALEQRLKTIDAISLINALARAERLGYEKGDILEGQPEGQPERVVPAAQMHSPRSTQVNLDAYSHPHFPQAAPRANALAHPVQPLVQHAPATPNLQCMLCWRVFKHTKPYEYHVQKRLCQKDASEHSPFGCEACGGRFTTKAGLQYHIERAVCGPHDTAPATPKSELPPPGKYLHHFIPPSSSQPQPLHSTLSQPTSSPAGNPSPSSFDAYAHLTLEKRNELEEELRQAEISFAPRFKEAAAILDLEARQQKVDSLNNSFSTKQSTIRKKYGVRLRVRRSRQEIENERLRRLGVKHGPSSPGTGPGTPSVKRQRSDNGPNGSDPPSYINRGLQTPVPVPQPFNHLSVSQMNNSGLGGSTATAAMTDPTASAAASQPPAPISEAKEPSPPNSLSSLQRKGYRVSSHVGNATKPVSPSPAERNGSTSTPIVVDLSSDSDTDTDMDEIPATVPPKKSS